MRLSFNLALAAIIGMFLGHAVKKVCEPEPEPPPQSMRRLIIDPSSPGPITDCPGRQYAAWRDDGSGEWRHDCVEFHR